MTKNPIIRTMNNRNWEQVFTCDDEDGIPYYDPTEREEPQNVRKFVTMDGEIYQFIYRHDLPWHRRMRNEVLAFFADLRRKSE